MAVTLEGLGYVSYTGSIDISPEGATTLLGGVDTFPDRETGQTLVAPDPDGNGLLNVGETFELGTVGTLTLRGTGFQIGGVTRTVLIATNEAGDYYIIWPGSDAPYRTDLANTQIEVSEAGYNPETDTMLCFARGTPIRTPEGYCAVERIDAGDEVLDRSGRVSKVVWIGSTTINVSPSSRAGLRPFRVPPHAFGHNMPYQEVYLSPQHRVVHSFDNGSEEFLVPVKALEGHKGIEVATDRGCITYYHILCDQHVILDAAGMSAESMFLGEYMRRQITENEGGPSELACLFPGIDEAHQGLVHTPALPLVKPGQFRRMSTQKSKSSAAQYENA